MLFLHPEGVLVLHLMGTERAILVLEVDMREEKSVRLGLDGTEEDLHIEESGFVEGYEEVAE